MTAYVSILISAGFDKFEEIINASPRQAKEGYFKRRSIRTKVSTNRFLKPGDKMAQRIEKLFDALKNNDDDELGEEILRAWLLSKRDLLANALDYLDIPHVNGLSDSDLSKFEKLSNRDVKKLLDHLKQIASDEDIKIYFEFMGVPHTETLFKH